MALLQQIVFVLVLALAIGLFAVKIRRIRRNILLGRDNDDDGDGDESDASTVRTFWTNVREPCYSQFCILCRTNARARWPKRNRLRMIVHRQL